MSLNIKTSTGLLEIGGNVTKEKVISALGYTPANEEIETTVDNHVDDSNIHITSGERELWTDNVENLDTHTSNKTVHITSAERTAWNNKSDFSGAYADLVGQPNITENETGNIVVADNSGNIIMQVDENGVSTTNVNTKAVQLNGQDLGSRLDSLESISLPNIVDNESGELTIADEAGNAIVKVDASGLETTGVTAKSVVVNGINVESKFDEHKADIDKVSGDLSTHKTDTVSHITSTERENWNKNIEDLSTHKADTTSHITATERTVWNNKSDFSGDYNDLTNAPNITENSDGNVIYADESGNIIARIDGNGLETTQVVAKTMVVNGTDVKSTLDETSSTLSSHIGNTTVHITSDERTTWNNKANQVDFENHVSNNSNPHNVTKAQVGLGNVDNTSDVNKPVSTAQQSALDNLKAELSESIVSESKEWTVADGNGNIVMTVDSDGLETTTVTAKNVVVNGTDIGTKINELDSHTSNTTVHITSAERTAWNAKATTTYVDNAVASIVDTAPEALNTLNELAAALGDDPNFATTVATQIGTKANQTDLNNHTGNKSNPHGVTAAQVGLGNVNNTSDANKPVSTAQQAALDSLRTELSETIVSDSKEWIVSDQSGNVVAKVDSNGLNTTTVTAKAVVVDGTDVKTALDGKSDTNHNHTITASASDDDVVVLTGTNGTNKVTYSASHANSGVTAGTYKSVTVNEKGHVTGGSNPTTLSGYGITDAAAKTHNHTKSEITDFPSSLKNPNALTIQGNGTTLTNGTYDGSAAKTVNITPASIGAAASSHGNHVPATETANNAKFLRNDNTWQTVTPANIGAAASSHGNHVPTTATADNATFLRNDNTWQKVTPTNIGAMDLTSAQTASGVKTFSNGIKIGGATLTYDSTNGRLVISFS